ncbi:hypothetical protein ASPCAL14114 [Aspergillus calidoustus]|uniref:Dienelactone hydrolase domain-containing protein n=1 Tax=Aspergillus calidoustus TaxID=454130 RepID=A0A0U5GM53_ASPCI|nr:hypothetical protein ASPCAL14114 [Aspergillus calidoustus]
MSFTRVTFPSDDIEVVGHLYAPAQGAPNRNGAAVVIGHPYTGVKEQVATFYAKYLANEGFYALAFDAAFQGKSAGEPRGLENPFQRAEDSRIQYHCFTCNATRDTEDLFMEHLTTSHDIT